MRRIVWFSANLVLLAGIAFALTARADSTPDASTPNSNTSHVDANGSDASAVATDAGAADAGATDGSTDAASSGRSEQDAAGAEGGQIWSSCLEYVPEGASRPLLTNEFPKRGLAGYALPLKINLEHGLGEKVLPNGFRIHGDSDAARALAGAGFILPAVDGGAGPSLTVREQDGKGLTEVVIHFVALPEKPGRHELTLPPIPIAISRASGELITLCTTPHQVVIDEPIANEPEASPQHNPPPRPQRELWTLARDVTYGLVVGAVVAALLTWLILMWLRRPKPPKPAPPPRPPWEVAFESLDRLRQADLVTLGKQSEHVDRVSDVVRIYLGARFGFDGIESTTDEVLQAMRKITPPLLVFDEVRTLLQDSDLVKFARWSPTDTDCEEVLVTAEQIVRATMPRTGESQVIPPAGATSEESTPDATHDEQGGGDA